MASTILKIVSNFETTLSTGISSSDTSLTLTSNITDDGTAIPSGTYGFTLEEGSSREEHIIGTVSGTSVTSLLRGVSTVDGTTEIATLKFQHRKGASIKITNHPSLMRVIRVLNGTDDLDGSNPLKYDSNPTLTDDKELATKKYIDDIAISGGVDASTSAKGISKLSYAPASASNPIAVGTNDPRFTTSSGTALDGSTNKIVDSTDTVGTGKVLRENTASIITAVAGEDITAGQGVYIATNNIYHDYSASAGLGDTGTLTVNASTFQAQSFTVPVNVDKISSIYVYMGYGGSTSTYNSTLTLYASDANNKPTGSSLGSATYTADSTTGYAIHTFSSPISVTSGNKYVFVLSTPGNNDTVRYSSSGTYSGGINSTSTDSGSTWTNNATNDLCFIVVSNIIQNTAGKAYKTNSNYGFDSVSFVGIAIESKSAGESVRISTSGIGVSTSLTPGSPVYLDSSGGFSSTPGTFGLSVGTAISSTSFVMSKVDNNRSSGYGTSSLADVSLIKISHGLSVNPKKIKLNVYVNESSSSANPIYSVGTYNGSLTKSIYHSCTGTTLYTAGVDGTNISNLYTGSGEGKKIIAFFDPSYIYLFSIKIGSPTLGTVYLWEAEA